MRPLVSCLPGLLAQFGFAPTGNPGDIPADGWTVWTPKQPTPLVNIWEAIEATRIFAQWGDPTNEEGVFTQNVKAGDFICNRPDDPNDFWCVDGNLFRATYHVE